MLANASLYSYRTQKNFGGGNFWQIITAEAIGEENFGESAGSLSVIPLYLYICIGEKNLANCIPFAKIFSRTYVLR